MQFWTSHPKGFDLCDPALFIDPAKGQYWYCADDFQYPIILPTLSKRLATNQFIWCSKYKNEYAGAIKSGKLVVWELNIDVPHEQVHFFNTAIWEELIRNHSNDWTGLLLENDHNGAGDNIGALVELPLLPEWLTNHGHIKLEIQPPK